MTFKSMKISLTESRPCKELCRHLFNTLTCIIVSSSEVGLKSEMSTTLAIDFVVEVLPN